jgi:hypothetical protein
VYSVYVDAVINHMASGSGTGCNDTDYSGYDMFYPGVPYGPNDFNGRDECPIDNLGIQASN